MLFSEIYGSYFNVIAAVLAEAVEGDLTRSRLTQIVQEKAFSESVLSIPAALTGGDWPLLDEELKTVIRSRPTMPLTTLQKRWLKALLLDPRIALFQPDPEGLEEVEPLFEPDVFVFYDRYTDGDPYDDPRYIGHFRTVLQAIEEKRMLRIRFRGHNNDRHSIKCAPIRLEYSAKDDKFRLLAAGGSVPYTVNIARIRSCEMLDACDPRISFPARKDRQELVFLLRDDRNAPERVLLHFSHFEKETVKVEDDLYRITLRYDPEDESELLIRVLSFGPVLQVVGPDSFIALIRQRLRRQMELSFASPPSEA